MYQALRLGTHVKNRAINYFIQMNISKWMTILKGGEHWITGFFLLLMSRRHFKFTPSEGIFRDRPLSFSQLVYSPSCFTFLMHIWSMAMTNTLVFDFPQMAATRQCYSAPSETDIGPERVIYAMILSEDYFQLDWFSFNENAVLGAICFLIL